MPFGELGADGGLVELAPVHDVGLLDRRDHALLAVPEGEAGLVRGQAEDGGDLAPADPVRPGGVPGVGAGLEVAEDDRASGRRVGCGAHGRLFLLMSGAVAYPAMPVPAATRRAADPALSAASGMAARAIAVRRVAVQWAARRTLTRASPDGGACSR